MSSVHTDDEDATTGKAKAKPPVDPLFVAQQKHRLAERLAILAILAGCSGKLDPATLTKIRLRWIPASSTSFMSASGIRSGPCLMPPAIFPAFVPRGL